MIITNRGPDITSTDYWDSTQADNGFFYLSWNAGHGRLLVPKPHEREIKYMASASMCIVSRGLWTDQGNREAWELLFEDGSDSPYCVHLGVDMSDRLLPDSDQGGGFNITLWTRKGLQGSLPGKYRRVATLPNLDPLTEQ